MNRSFRRSARFLGSALDLLRGASGAAPRARSAHQGGGSALIKGVRSELRTCLLIPVLVGSLQETAAAF
eukprot:9501028-Pyramimonas_sp.AAC.1